MIATKAQLSELVTAAFPQEPVPGRIFWEDHAPADDEFTTDIMARLANRRWTEVSVADWAWIGHVDIIRERLHPATFLYYLPSLLLGVIEEPAYLDRALGALIPPGRDRRPKSKWWTKFLEYVSLDQTAAIRAFVSFERTLLLVSQKNPFTITQDIALASEAETFWSEHAGATGTRRQMSGEP